MAGKRDNQDKVAKASDGSVRCGCGAVRKAKRRKGSILWLVSACKRCGSSAGVCTRLFWRGERNKRG